MSDESMTMFLFLQRINEGKKGHFTHHISVPTASKRANESSYHAFIFRIDVDGL
jgi:hypothetical protein